MRVLITGADGFAGSWLVKALLAAHHEVCGTTVGAGIPAAPLLTPAERAAVEWRRLELTDEASVQSALAASAGPWNAIVHLAAIAWSRDAADDPERARDVNVGGVARVVRAASELRRRGLADPVLLLASTGEVYGRDRDRAPHTELDAPDPVSPYSRGKLEAELEGWQIAREAGLRMIVARPFPHTGPGQRPVFVVPALLARLRAAKAAGAKEIPTGDLAPVRDFLDVRDVASAYLALLDRGRAGETYNVASGTGRRLQDIFEQLARLVQADITARPEASLKRPWDLP
ncbi:MAG TPA: NAD-dependent epimerase/dehydratase family protein, partial [Gemmatimonadales bacterium]|nr:NAD-dependent epimerase/dehydratase family protein [Gemmatimonadales bacterium]